MDVSLTAIFCRIDYTDTGCGTHRSGDPASFEASFPSILGELAYQVNPSSPLFFDVFFLSLTPQNEHQYPNDSQYHDSGFLACSIG